VIDRPIGTTHPEYKDQVYPAHYGHIPGIVSDIDQEEVDAYILGQTRSLASFTGKVIAVIYREDDEIKLVVTDGREMTKDEIESQVHFQEKYFKHRIYVVGNFKPKKVRERQ